ncbi:MucB/RseB C-terminal domain-containing protein [Thalassotalea sp. ND16A]|uniref:MucB/RseB C-terminal domain-containing protein n=1 Tax=Thalassotalea sp. ND16A TaxID=1535422 RepID=UPI00051CFF13|nr:MucB/RseB C-terminal domain-containing protein [Thalassotalea sp. ND16A]KGJ97700.1 putative sigma E regulatory protein, MucB/RseB [Thalassotalea sp. ND16A]
MNFFKPFLLLALFSTPAFSQDEAESEPAVATQQPPQTKEQAITAAETVKAPTALQWLQRLTHSMRTLNFDTSFVVVRNNRAEPYRWLHGISDEQELELITLLNGPRKEAIRLDDTVSYFESDKSPYSVHSNSIRAPIPAALFGDIEKLQATYNFIGVGKSRILGRPAQLVRLESKDKQRFGYWLWLDIESGLLLKVAVISRAGELLEQIQFTHLMITEKSNELLQQLTTAVLPEPLSGNKAEVKLPWQVNWLPAGFELIKSSKRNIQKVDTEVETLMFNDGLVDVSVYVLASDEAPRKATVNQTGATVLLSTLRDGYEITVVGKIPAKTANTIAESISFN